MRAFLRCLVVACCALCASLAFAQAQSTNQPEQVTVGFYVNDIQGVDLHANSFMADIYVWQRWKGDTFNPPQTLEFMNMYRAWDVEKRPLYNTPQIMPDGSKYMATRYLAQFSTPLPLFKYPFDDQKLVIEMEDNSASANKLVFIPDDEPVQMNPDISISGYRLGKPLLTVASRKYESTFGDKSISAPEPYSRVKLTIPIARPNITFGIKVIMPIFLVAACASLVFWVHPSLADGRIGLGITALLTLVALQLTTNDRLPDVDYLMMIDGLFLLAYLFVIASLGQVVRTSWLTHDGKDATAIAQDRLAFKVLSLSFVVGFIAIMLYELAQ